MDKHEARTQGAPVAELWGRLRTPHRADQRGQAARASFRNELTTQRTKVSGSSSAGVYSTSSPSLFANTTRSTPNSTCHWRQPPQGDAVITIRSKSPGL